MFEKMEANELNSNKPHGCAEGTGVAGRKCLASAKIMSRDGDKLLIVSSSSLLNNFFAKKALLTPCMLKSSNKIATTTLLDIRATGYLFIDPSMVRCVYDELQIKSIRLSKLKAIRGFNGKQVPDVTHAIYLTITIQDHKEATTSMLITKLGQHPIIFGKLWMKKHSVILDMKND